MPDATSAFDQTKLARFQAKRFQAFQVRKYFNNFNDCHIIYLIISTLVRTHITNPPADTVVLLGLTATLQCKVSSDQNVDYSVQWFRDKQ